jgi:hypothetical protein
MVAIQEAPGDTDIDRLRALATRTLNEHQDDRGLCAVCGSAWPCESVVLADHNLAFTSES